jgi:octaprenyl-diphosphate synthase
LHTLGLSVAELVRAMVEGRMKERLEAISQSILKIKIDDYRAKIDKAILAELSQRKNSVFYNPLMKAMNGGKRLRPILLVLSFESVNQSKANPFPAAVAVELAHTESLIHDDIIDRDFLRRETAAFHASYGNEMALLSADFILSMILDMTARYKDSRVAQVLAFATSEMCEGELEELMVYDKKRKLRSDEYVNIVSKKTASLFEASTKIGAIIAGAHKDEVEALSDYGRLVGIAYQIQDDITDLKKSSSVNILKLLDIDSERIRTLNEMSCSYILRAKERLMKFTTSRTKNLLLELADFIISCAVSRA